jgi:hypothetical protein
MPFTKIANATLQEPVIAPEDWIKLHGKHVFGHKSASGTAAAQTFRKSADTSKYLLSHCTIMASVMVEADPYDYLIKPECAHLVNNNDDAWTNEVLKLSHSSFVGAFNFVEHFQNSKYAKGHILDAILRKINLSGDGGVWVYFCDILVATDLGHEKLINDIRSEKVKYLSMGCVTDLVICSYCGARVTDQNTYCNHLSYQKGMFLTDDDGIARRVAELCGHKTMENGGVKFVEASWVATPAFPGAAKRNTVAEEWVGPRTKYTKSSAAGKMAKIASGNDEFETLDLGDALMSADLHGRLIR